MHDDLKRAIDTFNRGEYMAAGEMFEVAIRAVDSDLKPVVEALNRVAAALHLRLERGGRQGAINLLSQAMLTIDDLKPARGGIDLERLYNEISAFTDDLRATPRDERDGLKHRARLFIERRRAPRIKLT